ncbi:hypothetical protein E4U43_008489 [Claviceps pusilla]|uniref:Meiotic cohesin rec8 n=1 Tax=Claviceps pusilla TaxID=123648 RepID=A0A9P7SZN2_9HYPO|nr:hypothetical protein E4U43_008489 [Claviceps pusilla]
MAFLQSGISVHGVWYSAESLVANEIHVRLVATVGNSSQRRLKRKTIQGVNVPKACQKIIDPGAPLALRLQGKLLYGVSRVFAHQCNYVLSDAEKTQADMMTFFRSMNTSETDPKAGKTKRHHIMLPDDPQFDPLAMLPRLDEILSYDIRTNLISTQESSYKFSQLSPMDRSAVPSACTSRRSSIVGLDLPPSSLSVGSYQLPGTLCHSSPFDKAFREPEAMQVDRPFSEHEFDFDPICGMGLEFDADGNLVSIMDAEPQLPPLPGTSPDPLHSADPTLAQAGGRADQQTDQLLDEDSLVDFGEAALPDAEAFAVQVQPADGQATGTDGLLTLTTETAEAGNTSAAMHAVAVQGRALKNMIDREIRVPRDAFRAWTKNYAASMQSAARRRVKITTLAKAKANALRFVYSNGISGVGAMQRELGVQHPLAADFAGTALQAHMLGLPVDVIEKRQATRGRRRKSPEAFDDDDQEAQEDGRNTRNVKQRLDHGDQLGRRQQSVGFGDELELPFGDDSAPEIGMEAAPAMEDKNSSLVLMPWSRHGSAVPGSATRAPGSAQKSITAPSPLHGRGSIVGSIERHSDPVDEPFKDVIGLGPEPDSSLFGQDPDDADLNGPDNSNNQGSIAGLDISSHDFLDYVTEQIHHRGDSRLNPQDGKRWIRFEQLASPAIHSKMVAAQAFLHILSLATKNVIAVEQDGLQNKEPFGALHIGLTTHVSRGFSEP